MTIVQQSGLQCVKAAKENQSGIRLKRSVKDGLLLRKENELSYFKGHQTTHLVVGTKQIPSFRVYYEAVKQFNQSKINQCENSPKLGQFIIILNPCSVYSVTMVTLCVICLQLQYTPLHISSHNGHEQLVAHLISVGADIECRDDVSTILINMCIIFIYTCTL